MDENDGIIRVQESIKMNVERVIFPLPGLFKSPFNTLQEWLLELCNDEPDTNSVAEYCLLYHSQSEQSIVGFVGHSYSTVGDVVTRKISFTPKHMFFPLPKREYRKLSYKDASEKFYKELKQFTKSGDFHNSFMSKNIPVNTNFGGQIWPE